MATGTVEAIFVAAAAAGTMEPVKCAEAVAGHGLVGDRYGGAAGTFSKTPEPAQQVSLIEAEAVEGACREHEIELAARDTRRNIVTRGVALNHLIDREFTIGSVVLRGLEMCEPCGHMQRLCGVDGARDALIHRGGLRAEVLTGGEIAVGDGVVV